MSTTLRRYVAYYRVSTARQGASGLGLEAQQSAVKNFVQGTIVAEYTEVESGKKDQRIKLKEAIDRAKQEGATLVIAKLDRLSRNASFIFALRDSGVNFQCVDMPEANTLTIGVMASMAQHERELISERTKRALAEKKRTGHILGKPENLTPEAMAKGRQVHQAKARENLNNRQCAAFAYTLREKGERWTKIASILEASGFKTRKGRTFKITQVQRLLKLYNYKI